MTKRVRTGILGGTFNPVHVGHLHLAEVAMQALDLDHLVFIPSASPPHKRSDDLCLFDHRLAMLKLAVTTNPKFSVSDIEGRRQGLSFTIDTLRQLFSDLNRNEELVFIMGFDAFAEMGTWKEYTRIPDYATIAVCERDGGDIGGVAQNLFVNPACVQEFAVPVREVSSSLVRELLREQAQEVTAYVPSRILAYINKHGLFQRIAVDRR